MRTSCLHAIICAAPPHGVAGVALTSNVSSFRNKVVFQVRGGLSCNWSAGSALIEAIATGKGSGTQYVTGVLSANPNHEGRTAVVSVTSGMGGGVRTATVTQA